MKAKVKYRLDPNIDKLFNNQMGRVLENSENLQQGVESILALVRFLEGESGILGQIAAAYNDELKSQKFVEQIKELGEKKYIPKKIKVTLDYLRLHSNLARHPGEEYNKYSIEEIERLKLEFLEILNWFYCECDKGPKYASIMLPLLIVTAQVGHRRTLFGVVSINDREKCKVEKINVIESHEFFRERGFDLFRGALSIFRNGYNPQGYAISLACPVDRDGRRLISNDWSYWPTDVTTSLDISADTSLIMNDAFAFGFTANFTRPNERTLVLTLGSGVGCAIARNDNGNLIVKPIELGIEQYTIDNLTGHAYELIGWKYFEDLHTNNTYDYPRIVLEYTRRVAGFINVLRKKYMFDSVILGGGRSVYLSSEMLKRDFGLANIPINILSDDKNIIKALAIAWTCKIKDNLTIYDSL